MANSRYSDDSEVEFGFYFPHAEAKHCTDEDEAWRAAWNPNL